jgi:hypothetical protein
MQTKKALARILLIAERDIKENPNLYGIYTNYISGLEIPDYKKITYLEHKKSDEEKMEFLLKIPFIIPILDIEKDGSIPISINNRFNRFNDPPREFRIISGKVIGFIVDPLLLHYDRPRMDYYSDSSGLSAMSLAYLSIGSYSSSIPRIGKINMSDILPTQYNLWNKIFVPRKKIYGIKHLYNFMKYFYSSIVSSVGDIYDISFKFPMFNIQNGNNKTVITYKQNEISKLKQFITWGFYKNFKSVGHENIDIVRINYLTRLSKIHFKKFLSQVRIKNNWYVDKKSQIPIVCIHISMKPIDYIITSGASVKCKFCGEIFENDEYIEQFGIEKKLYSDEITRIILELYNFKVISTGINEYVLSEYIISIIGTTLEDTIEKLHKKSIDIRDYYVKFTILATVVTIVHAVTKIVKTIRFNRENLLKLIKIHYNKLLLKLGMTIQSSVDKILEYWDLDLVKQYLNPKELILSTFIEQNITVLKEGYERYLNINDNTKEPKKEPISFESELYKHKKPSSRHLDITKSSYDRNELIESFRAAIEIICPAIRDEYQYHDFIDGKCKNCGITKNFKITDIYVNKYKSFIFDIWRGGAKQDKFPFVEKKITGQAKTEKKLNLKALEKFKTIYGSFPIGNSKDYINDIMAIVSSIGYFNIINKITTIEMINLFIEWAISSEKKDWIYNILSILRWL